MLSEKFFNTIDNSIIGKFIASKQKIIEQTDPNRIYVENIRSFFHLPYKIAYGLCELAVKHGTFEKAIGVECKTCGRIIKSYKNAKEIGNKIICYQCQLNEEDEFDFMTSELNKITYYKLKATHASQ